MIRFSENQMLYVYLLFVIYANQLKMQENEDKRTDGPINEDKFKNVILSNESRQKRAAISDHDRLWEEGVIPYEIQPDCSRSLSKTIRSAMDEWEAKTCLKFVEAEQIHPEKLVIRNKGKCGCCTEIGRRYKLRQYLTLDEDQCNYKEAVLHELGHTIGFDHEHKRPDRDKHVKILYENIEKEFSNQFSKLDKGEVNSLGSPYDFDSIMHYSSDVYAISLANETMQALNSSVSLKEFKMALSPTDIEQTNRLYKCPNCLFNLYDAEGVVMTDGIDFKSETVHCQWYIRRNRGEFIRFFLDYVNILESENCADGYLELRDGYWSKSPLIGRFCGNNSLQKYYQTQSHTLLITYKSNNASNYAGFLLNYTVICTGRIEAERGVLESEYLQESYSILSQCKWIIAVPPDYRVALHFEALDAKQS
ncbi:protein tolkin-like [Centruroides vittatus]|uniref:protein tolkin-like n=1 Tax=Centruroides vittatus TaxID=120091 RepID=UPI0035104880